MFNSKFFKVFEKNCLNIKYMYIFKLCKIDKLASWDESLRAKLATIRMFLPIWNMDRNLIHQLANNLKEVI